MNQKILLVDVDDCVVKWSTHFRKYFKDNHGHIASVRAVSETEAYSHIPVVELEKYITDFNQSEHFENLKPKADACKILPRLKSEGWTIVGITACGRDQKTAELRWNNLNKAFGEGTFSDVRFINWYECKSEHLKDFTNCPFIDDNIKHAETAQRMGHDAMIMHRSYRRKFKHPTIPVVHDWNEIYEKIAK